MTALYYLHENAELIFKPNVDDVSDYIDSDFVKTYWLIDNPTRAIAWTILVEALAGGAKEDRVRELAEKWQCDNSDAKMYAKYIGVELDEVDVNTYDSFVDPALSPKLWVAKSSKQQTIGKDALEALTSLAIMLGYKPGKFWNPSFVQLLRNEVKGK